MNQKHGLFESMNLDEKTGCWNWTGARNRDGYGTMRFMGKVRKVHRVAAAIWLKFAIESEKLVLHHCDNPSCFNPKHLFVGTNRDNVLDAVSKGRQNQVAKKFCPKGHPYSGDNLYIRPDRQRERGCKTCRGMTLVPRPRTPRTHCVHGHEYTEVNTYRGPDGTRERVVCRKSRRKNGTALHT